MRFIVPLLLSNLVSLNASVAKHKNGSLRHEIQHLIQDTTEECQLIFHELDVNNDATLTRDDLVTVLLGHGFTPDESNELLSKVGENAMVGMAEFCSGGKKREAVPEKKKVLWKHEKAALKQKLSGMFHTLQLSEHSCPGAFDERDSNGDGYIRMSDVEDALDSYDVPYRTQQDLLDDYGRYDSRDSIDFDDFARYFCEGNPSADSPRFRNDNRSDDDRSRNDNRSDDPQTLTNHQCEGAFDEQDTNDDGRIRMRDVEDALEDYDIPSRDIETLLDDYGRSSDEYIRYGDFEDYFCGGNKKRN